jgi:hypothetical protein
MAEKKELEMGLLGVSCKVVSASNDCTVFQRLTKHVVV